MKQNLTALQESYTIETIKHLLEAVCAGKAAEFYSKGALWLLKKVMFALMAVIAGSRFFALAFILSTDKNRFPVPIYISTGIIALLGIGLVCKRIISTVHTKELIFFYMATSVSVLFNLLFIKMFSRMEVSLFDFLMIGTLMDIVVAVTLTVMTLKERRYVRLAVATAKS